MRKDSLVWEHCTEREREREREKLTQKKAIFPQIYLLSEDVSLYKKVILPRFGCMVFGISRQESQTVLSPRVQKCTIVHYVLLDSRQDVFG